MGPNHLSASISTTPPQSATLPHTMANFVLALLSSALLLGSALSQDVAATCNAECDLSCSVQTSECSDLIPLNDCAKDKKVCMEECNLECVCDTNCLNSCLSAESDCEAAADGMLAALTCKGKTVFCEATCPAKCAVSTGKEALADLNDLARRRK